MDRLSFLGKRRSPPSSSSSNGWTVVRLGAKDAATRTQEGDAKSCQRKTECSSLMIRPDGVQGTAVAATWWKFWTTPKPTTIHDYNHYRSQGHSGRFDAGTNDRAVSIATVAAYTRLQTTLGCRIAYGDLGDNILLDTPTGSTSTPLAVGTRLRLGPTVVLEITEVNNPCYRFNTQSWAAAAREKWGATSPEGPDHWFKSPECPLNHEVHPGIRGFLAKVITEGEVTKGDTAVIVEATEQGTGEVKDGKSEPRDEDEDARPSPTKKLKTTKAENQ